ncbi:MAG: hypothetical protein FWE00_00990 [Defluviitaleaceae bacterium]|nr:hypothetical protein [Defluviitaleaceae bacterium]
MTGWVKIYRELLEKPIWCKSSAEQKAVLITILLLASHTEKEWEWQGKKFAIQPGQFITSSTSLANAAGVSRQNVRTALVRFTKYEFLTYQSTKTGLFINILNWGIYQGFNNAPNQHDNQSLTNSQPTANQDLTTIKNVKNNKELKNVKNNPSIAASGDEDAPQAREVSVLEERFNEFWAIYPKKTAKKTAFTAWKKAKPSAELHKKIIEAVEAAKHSDKWQRDNGQYIPNPATWINGGCWDDDITPTASLNQPTPSNEPIYGIEIN